MQKTKPAWMGKMIRTAKRRGERGQTMILVAISIVSLLAMAALAIDVVTLYVASSEIKRAADAAALAGAKGIADSGVTTLSLSDPEFPTARDNVAVPMANAAIAAILPANTVAGAQPAMPSPPVFDWSRQGNPLITVSLQQSNLPTFFARIWGRSGSTVSASSVAEVYNPSNNSSYAPIAPTAVKPWLVANADLDQPGNQFIQTGNLVETNAIGETFDLTPDCNPFGFPSNCQLWHQPLHPGEYVPALVASNTVNNVCPSCSAGIDFEQSISCADMTTSYLCGAGGASWDQSVNPGGFSQPTALGTECLIHATGPGLNAGQDQLYFPPFPTGPPQITANSGPYSGSLVSTSSSVVTLPIVDPASVTQNVPPVTVVGFMQAFINQVGYGSAGKINITVLNIAGCIGTSNSNPPVVGGRGTSPVAVRLIAAP